MRVYWIPLAVSAALAPNATAQGPIPGTKTGGSTNIHVMSHVPIGGFISVGDLEIEQELSRPYAYVGLARPVTGQAGFVIISLKDPAHASVIYRWIIDNSPLHAGVGGFDGKYFKHRGRYYYEQAMQFGQSGPDAEVGSIIFDVTTLPDTSKIREIGRLRAPATPNGSTTRSCTSIPMAGH